MDRVNCNHLQFLMKYANAATDVSPKANGILMIIPQNVLHSVETASIAIKKMIKGNEMKFDASLVIQRVNKPQ